jgi:hypothetical protein
MTVSQIEKLKARLATASPAEARIIKELIQTLEADAPDAVPHRDRTGIQERVVFLARWSGNSKCSVPATWLATFEENRPHATNRSSARRPMKVKRWPLGWTNYIAYRNMRIFN